MRRAARVDANQAKIVEALRAVGASVAITSALGDGFADIVVGWQGKNFLMEIKNPDVDATHQKLTKLEEAFRDGWRGQYSRVLTIDEALALLGIVRGPGLRPASHGGQVPGIDYAGGRKRDETPKGPDRAA